MVDIFYSGKPHKNLTTTLQNLTKTSPKPHTVLHTETSTPKNLTKTSQKPHANLTQSLPKPHENLTKISQLQKPPKKQPQTRAKNMGKFRVPAEHSHGHHWQCLKVVLHWQCLEIGLNWPCLKMAQHIQLWIFLSMVLVNLVIYQHRICCLR